MWVGQGDLPTPRFICDAAAQAMAAGDTFYTHKRGIPELRAALIDYHRDLYGVEIADSRIAVTSSGMNADDADRADPGLRRRQRRVRDPGLAEHLRRDPDPGRHRAPRADDRHRSRLGARHRSAVRGVRRAHPRHLPRLARQPDRLGHAGGAAPRRPRVRQAARHRADRRRGLQPPDLQSPGGALVPGDRRARRSPVHRQQLFQDLGDDRLARRLDRPAARPDRPDGPADRVQYLGWAELPAGTAASPRSARASPGSNGWWSAASAAATWCSAASTA